MGFARKGACLAGGKVRESAGKRRGAALEEKGEGRSEGSVHIHLNKNKRGKKKKKIEI